MKHGGIAEIIKFKQAPGIHGTRDSFGVGRKFYHTDENGTREITTWKEWERAGYKDATTSIKDSRMRNMVKEKQKRLKDKGVKSLLEK